MNSPICQNDDAMPEKVRKAGCLFRALGMLAEIEAGQTLTRQEILEQYLWLQKEGYMKENCWVLDHEQVIKSAQYYLGVPQRAKYLVRAEDDSHDFDFSEGATAPNAYIAHIRMGSGIGHFYVCNDQEERIWDPFWPAPNGVEYRGYRAYRVGG